MTKIPVWIDTDTGVDDAIALLTAFTLDNIEICGISAVAGNTTLDNAFRNARNVTYLAKHQDIKVYKGSEKPLIKELKVAVHAHGENGLGGAIIEDSTAKEETIKAWDALYNTAKTVKKLTIVAVGPLTNIAIAIIKHPDIVDYIETINIMGGAAIGGNVTPCAEFNIYTDPHAAETVFKCGAHVNMFGLDVTLKALLTEQEGNELSKLNNKAAKLFKDSTGLMYNLLEAKIQPGLCMHDCCPVVYLKHPEWFKGVDCGVYVETQGTISQGKTVSDIWTDFKYQDRHCTVFLDVDRDAFAKFIYDVYKQY